MKVRIRRRAHYLKVQNFGPVKSANVEFGDLTVLVGPQATGKSVFLQLLKLLIDVRHIKYEFKRAGIDWSGRLDIFLDVYFGEGMRALHKKNTKIWFEGAEEDLPRLLKVTKPAKGESMFFIPAQRVLTLREGWPQAFVYYDPGVPFTVREFSEELRILMTDLGPTDTLFPVPRRLKQEFRDLLQRHIFAGYDLKIDTQRAQKRLVLSAGANGTALPFMVWSAGQREFVPLMLGLYHLLTPAGAAMRSGMKWVVIEELEMGLHPRAIAVIMLMVFELVHRGYRVCISTHSPQVLDAIWALKRLRENAALPESLLQVFDAPKGLWDIAEGVMKKRVKVFYFDRNNGTKDISDLDVSSEEAEESGWGGLAEFSGRANEAVARAVANSKD
jgi:AAA domain, putative AbiEii toxin, Type IV TA system/AAA ATPase domain